MPFDAAFLGPGDASFESDPHSDGVREATLIRPVQKRRRGLRRLERDEQRY